MSRQLSSLSVSSSLLSIDVEGTFKFTEGSISFEGLETFVSSKSTINPDSGDDFLVVVRCKNRFLTLVLMEKIYFYTPPPPKKSPPESGLIVRPYFLVTAMYFRTLNSYCDL